MTDQQQVLSRKYLIYKIVTNLWFVNAVWLYFYRLFITDREIGILDGTAFTIGLIFEVPSGVLADKFGRDKVVRLGHILSGSGLILQSLSSNLYIFILGQAIVMIGVSFVSGASDALFFENLNFSKDSLNWRKLVARGSQIGLLSVLFATISGGFLDSIEPRVPWILNGLSFIIAAIVIWSVKDKRVVKDRGKFLSEFKDYLIDIKSGFFQFKKSSLWFYVPYILTVQGLFYTIGYGLLRLILIDRFDFSSIEGAITIGVSSILTVVFLHFLNVYSEKISEKLIFFVVGIMTGICLFTSNFEIGLLGGLVILILYVGEHLLDPIMSEVLNNCVDNEKRATVLSVASFLKTLPYIGLAPIIGYLSTEGKLEYFLTVWSGLIFIAVIIYIIFKKKDSKVEIIE